MFSEGVRDKALRRGPNRMLEVLRQKYPSSHDLPSEAEIRMAISRLMQQNRNNFDSIALEREGEKERMAADH